MYPILLLTACLSAGCGGTGVSGNAAEGTNLSGTDERKPTATVCNETRTVSLKDPYMQNAQVLTIECLPGWQLVGKVDLEDFQQANGTPNAQIKEATEPGNWASTPKWPVPTTTRTTVWLPDNATPCCAA